MGASTRLLTQAVLTRQLMRILWLKTELLHPTDKGGKIRTYQMLKELKRNHRITYLTLDDEADPEARERAPEYADELVCIPHHSRDKFTPGFYGELGLNLFSRLPYAIAKYRSPAMRRKITELTSTNLFDVVVCDFLAPAINVPRKLSCRSVLFQHNVEAMIWKRHYETQANPIKKAYLYWQWRKMRAFEGVMCRRFDSVIAVSREDSDLMRREYLVPNLDDVPTGVDTAFFRPGIVSDRREPNTLVFTGSMDWLPNQDAIQYFTAEIMPLIKRKVPTVTLTVVGRNPYPALIELSKRDPSVIVTGRVADVRPYMERAAAYVVPLRIGGGTRLKIFEAMAMEKPIVSTTIGAEGLPVHDGSELLLADTPVAFAEAVIRVLSEQELATNLARCAAGLVRQHFGWDRVASRFAEVCAEPGSKNHTLGVASANKFEMLETAVSPGRD